MSLDDNLDDESDEELLFSTLEQLETTWVTADMVAENDEEYPEEDVRVARNFLEEYQLAVINQVPSDSLRAGFKYFADIAARKAVGPEYGSLKQMNLVSWTVCITLGLNSLIDSISEKCVKLPSSWLSGLGIAGVVVSSVLNYRENRRERADASREVALIHGASDDVWKEALSRLHDEKYESDYND